MLHGRASTNGAYSTDRELDLLHLEIRYQLQLVLVVTMANKAAAGIEISKGNVHIPWTHHHFFDILCSLVAGLAHAHWKAVKECACQFSDPLWQINWGDYWAPVLW